MIENSFRNIILPDLQHVMYQSYNMQDPGNKKYKANKESNVDSIEDIHNLINYNFTKKYNLIYPNESFSHHFDPSADKDIKIEIYKKIAVRYPDLNFMIIENDSIEVYNFKELKNIQIWPRKYFTCQAFGLSHINSEIENLDYIQKQRTQWFCSILGSANYFRSELFHWFIDKNLNKNNKISYICTNGTPKLDPDEHRALTADKIEEQENYLKNNGLEKYKTLIPFNNFEKEILPNFFDRLTQRMPIYDCLFNIVLETFATNFTIFFTEKTWKSIFYGHWPLIISNPGSMKNLSSMGFLIPDYIKWPMWDDIPIDQINYRKLDIIKEQLSTLFSTQDIKDIANDWYPYAIKNFKLLQKMKNNNAEEEKEICRWILSSCNALSNKKYQYLYNTDN